MADEVIGKDLFGENVYDPKRSMKDFFLVPPFSILDTMGADWQARKKRWNGIIGDDGESRKNALYGKGFLKNAKPDHAMNSVSILDPCLAELMCTWFASQGHCVFDPFAGDSVFGYVSAYLGLKFTGIELREEQVAINANRLADAGLKGEYICDTSENMDSLIADNSQDFIFSCPPYADLEVYSKDERDLSTMSHTDFLIIYEKIISNTYKKLKQNRFACIVISEVRTKGGGYIGLVPRTVAYMTNAGYTYYNEMILVNSVGTLPMRAGRFMNAGRKVGRRHQNVLIFYKGDTKKIKDIYGELIPENEYYKDV